MGVNGPSNWMVKEFGLKLQADAGLCKGTGVQEHLLMWKTMNGSGRKQREGQGRLGQVVKGLECQVEEYGLCPAESGSRRDSVDLGHSFSGVTSHC